MNWSEVVQSCPTLCDPVDCSLPGFSVHGIFQARVLEWAAISFSKGSSWPRNWTWVSCIAGRCFTLWATREEPWQWRKKKKGDLQGMQPLKDWLYITEKCGPLASACHEKSLSSGVICSMWKLNIDWNGGDLREGKTLKSLLQGNKDFCLVAWVGAETIWNEKKKKKGRLIRRK